MRSSSITAATQSATSVKFTNDWPGSRAIPRRLEQWPATWPKPVIRSLTVGTYIVIRPAGEAGGRMRDPRMIPHNRDRGVNATRLPNDFHAPLRAKR